MYEDLFTAVRRSLFSRFKWSTEALLIQGNTYYKVILRCGNNKFDFTIEPYQDNKVWRRNFASGVLELKSKAIKVAWRDGV
jgi:hypothetical protein